MPERVQKPPMPWGPKQGDGDGPRSPDISRPDTRDLLKKVETLQNDLNFQDRPMLDKVKARVQQVHDELLTGLMEGKKK